MQLFVRTSRCSQYTKYNIPIFFPVFFCPPYYPKILLVLQKPEFISFKKLLCTYKNIFLNVMIKNLGGRNILCKNSLLLLSYSKHLSIWWGKKMGLPESGEKIMKIKYSCIFMSFFLHPSSYILSSEIQFHGIFGLISFFSHTRLCTYIPLDISINSLQ